MRITNHNSQMANVISETNIKREFNFWKNALLTTTLVLNMALNPTNWISLLIERAIKMAIKAMVMSNNTWTTTAEQVKLRQDIA